MRGSLLSGNRTKSERNSADRAAKSPGTAGTGDLLEKEDLDGLSAGPWFTVEGFCMQIWNYQCSGIFTCTCVYRRLRLLSACVFKSEW